MSLYRKIALARIRNFQILMEALESLEYPIEAANPEERGANPLGAFQKVQIEITLPAYHQNSSRKVGIAAMNAKGKTPTGAAASEITHYQLEGDFDSIQMSANEFSVMLLRAYVTIGAEKLLAEQGFELYTDWQQAENVDEIPFEKSGRVNVRELVRLQ